MQRWSRLVTVCVLVLCIPSAQAADASLDQFYGEWQGVDLEVHTATAELKPVVDDLDVAIQPDGDGFRVRWTSFQRDASDRLERQAFEARFGPTERPGVFAFDQDQRSFFGRLFAAPASGNPLEGETLLWARLGEASLILYSLGLTERGRFDLNRHQWTLAGDQLTVAVTRRTAEGRETWIEGRLEPAGG